MAMTLWWWSCSACGYRTCSHHSLGAAEHDRDDHIAWTHPAKQWAPHQFLISHYTFLEVHA